MAIIGKIRQRSGLVIGIIALSLLAFILTDAFSSNNSWLGGNQDMHVGEMAGKKIRFDEFDGKVKEIENNIRVQMGGGELPDIYKDYPVDQTWEMYFRDIVLEKEFDKLRIEVSPEELTYVEFLAPEPNQTIVSYFTNPQTGQVFDQFKNPLTGQLDLSKAAEHRKNMEAEEEKNWVQGIDKQVIEQTKSRKYFMYIRKATYTTSLEAKEDQLAQTTNIKGQVVSLNYNSIPDSTIKVTEAEMEEYLRKNPKKFEQEESRKLEYVVFDIFPSREDSANAQQWAMERAEGLKNAKNDSTYVINNGGDYDSTFIRRGTLPASTEEEVFTAEKGAVVGPLFDNGDYIVYKVLDTKNDTVVYVRGAQILLRPNGVTKADTADTRAKAADILKDIRSGKVSWEEAVKIHSLDPTTNNKGGDFGWMEKTTKSLPQDLVNALSRNGVGEYSIVTTGQGVHIVKVTHSPSSKAVKLAQIRKTVEPLKQTLKSISASANEFAGSVQTEEQFNAAIEKQGLAKRFADNVTNKSKDIGGIQGARRVVQWAFDDKRKEGDISEPFDVASGTRIMVVRLVGIREKGTPKVADIKDKLEEAVRIEKKAEELRKKFEEAMNGSTTLAQVAEKIKAPVMEVPYLSFSSTNVPNIGSEPTVVGAMFGSEAKKLSEPVKGQNGVYVFWVESREEGKVPDKLDDIKTRMNSQVLNTVDMRANDAIKKIADIKDYRYKFY